MKKYLFIILFLFFCSCGILEKYKTRPLDVKILNWSWDSKLKPYPSGNDTWYNAHPFCEASIKNETGENIFINMVYLKYWSWYNDFGFKTEAPDGFNMGVEKIDGTIQPFRSWDIGFELKPSEVIKVRGKDRYDNEHLVGIGFSIHRIIIEWSIEGKEQEYYQEYIFNYEDERAAYTDYYETEINIEELRFGDREDRPWS